MTKLGHEIENTIVKFDDKSAKTISIRYSAVASLQYLSIRNNLLIILIIVTVDSHRRI